MHKVVAAFLDGHAACMGLCGPVGCGKLHLVEKVARAMGWQHQIIDRSQGAINWSRLGQHTLGGNGLIPSLYIVCNAKETSWDFLPRLTGKFVFIANDEQQLAGLKKAKIPVEKLKKPSVDQMTTTLFLEHDWPVEKAKRLSQLAEGDWRRLWALDKLFRGAKVDVASASEDEFQASLATMAKDKRLDVHPTMAVYDLFSGASDKKRQPLENYADMGTLSWGEANLGVACGSVDDMLLMQESAVLCDVLMSTDDADAGFARDLGLDHFVRSAAAQARAGLRYDYQSYANPWSKVAKSVEPIRASYDETRSSNWWLKRAPADDGGVEEIGDSNKRPRATAKTKAKAKPKAAAMKKKTVTKRNVPVAK